MSSVQLRDDSDPSRNKDVISANWDILYSMSFIVIPFIFVLSLILMARISAHIIKNVSTDRVTLTASPLYTDSIWQEAIYLYGGHGIMQEHRYPFLKHWSEI